MWQALQRSNNVGAYLFEIFPENMQQNPEKFRPIDGKKNLQSCDTFCII